MKLVMTLLVRDAEKIVRDNLEFHLIQGVDFFIITDNLSRDATASIIGEYVKMGVAEVISEPDDTYMQGRWVTRMARRAAELGADWIINSDDDEFWFSSSGSVREVLAAEPLSSQALTVERHNHVLVSNESGWFAEAMRYRERHSYNALGKPLPAKVCHRGFFDVEVSQGCHGVKRAGVPLATSRCERLAIAHYPIRDYASFENKIAKGGAAYTRNTVLGPRAGATWRYLYDLWLAGELLAWFERQLFTTERIAEGLADGSLVEDLTVPDTLRRSR